MATPGAQITGQDLNNSLRCVCLRPMSPAICGTSKTDSEVVVEISDTGVGIPAAIHIWEAFKMTKASGTGLGLVIVRQIVSAHRGAIIYTSEPGKGTMFRVSLPVSAVP